MRKGYSTQLRLDSLSIDQVPLNFECRSRIVPILRALQKVYSNAEVTARVMQLIEADVNRETRKDCGRKCMDYWHIMVLASVRLNTAGPSKLT
jgi:transposase, IS5 family